MLTKFNRMGHLFKLTKFKYNQECDTKWTLRPLKERDWDSSVWTKVSTGWEMKTGSQKSG